jgi:hypothetical protein
MRVHIFVYIIVFTYLKVFSFQFIFLSPNFPSTTKLFHLDVSGVQAANTRQKLLADLKSAVKGAVAATIASNKSTITDEEPAGGVLFSALEASLMFGLRGMTPDGETKRRKREKKKGEKKERK